ncbi:membrane bound O-acyl transferase family-domain-containing protein [Lentinula edodes]|uniref:membrane bound O-acyl transferase family-domain-containing protein n=1 Tax=Lentinula edodes TaxID=5353 RepID=UPI001E8CCC4A|nr:membrane bound O-acyl transferase family-domain-containing protein [Lentinula edodes]KAH7874290.1 membrane bound O-acyl transferase family-domain-containing protein [Lentinula edodes]
MEYTSPKYEVQTLLFSIIYIFVPAILLACVIAFRCPTWVRLLFFVWYTSHLLQGMSLRTGNSWVDYSNGSTLGGELTKTFYLLFLVNPARDWSHGSDAGKRIDGRPWWKRVYWCLCAAYTMRGVGWNYQVPGVPSPSKMNRYMFLGCTALRVVTAYLLLDFAQYSMQATPFFNDPQTRTSMRSYSYALQAFYMLVCFSVPYGALRFYYYTGAFLAVLTGYSSQEDWPDLFGNWFDAYSVRNMWGKTWHQMLRRHSTSFGKAATKLLGARPRSALSLIIQLFTAFLVSGVMHSFGDYTVGLQHLGITLPFFVLQPFAILFEELFIFGLVHPKAQTYHICSLPSPIKRFLGYIWTLSWFTYSSSWYIDPIAQAGFGKDDIVPFSLVRFVVRLVYQHERTNLL